MKKDNILADKSFKFAVKIVDLYNHLREEICKIIGKIKVTMKKKISIRIS